MLGAEADFDLTVTVADGSRGAPIRITVQGELDHAVARRLLEAFRVAMPENQGTAVVLDLGQVTFIDSTGMRALVTIEHESERAGVVLSLVPPPEPLTRLLRIAGVAERVSLVAPLEAPLLELDFLEGVEIELAITDDAPRRARAAVREALSGTVDGEVLPRIVLMASELVTNAVIHSAPADPPLVGLRLLTLPGAIRVEVDDPGGGFDPAGYVVPERSLPGPGTGGRGLFVVDRSATRWGSRRADTDRGLRFSVWFEVETH